MANDELLSPSYMTKRAQNKSRFSTINYKSRWFKLNCELLSYHDGGIQNEPGKEKGRVYLKDIRYIEPTEADQLGGRPNAFQIAYKEETCAETYSLYIIAVCGEQRDQWIKALLEACQKKGVVFSEQYHPGVWNNKSGFWTCCDKRGKNSPGCEECTNKTNAITNGTARGARMPTPPQRQTGSGDSVKRVIALYPYEPVHPGDLRLESGEEYDVVDDTKPHWWKARNKAGESGHIPSNYVDIMKDDGLEKYGWYYKGVSRSESESILKNEKREDCFLVRHGWYYKGVSRSESESILKNEKREGCFLVRDSSQKGMYTLSLFTMEVEHGMTRHYHIKKNKEDKFYLSEKHAHATIPDLIHYHKFNSGGLVVRLRTPPSDRQENIPATVGIGYDKYELDPEDISFGELLGSGQFGTVKKGRYKNTKEVAIKEMLGGAMREDDFIEEARTMMQFQHKNLVQLYGVCTKSRPIYIVLEYMKNGALLQYLRRRKTTLLQDKDKLLYMCLQICDAMKYLESKLCIHRDLAARNCLVGEKDLVKVGDFGLARYVLDDEYTSSSGTKFPVKWAPPEVLGYTKFSSKSDVWAYGITMWEIWTGGDMPYLRMRNPEVVEKVCHQNYKLSKPKDCPPAVYNVMRRCWETEPEHRPPFSELLKLLEQVKQGMDDYCE